MKQKKVIAFFTYYSRYIPIKFNFILLLVSFFLINKIIIKALSNTESSYAPILRLTAKITLLSIVLIICISFLSTLFCYIYFIIRKNKNDISISILENKNNTEEIVLQTSLPNTYKPILGFVKASYLYDHEHWTEKLILAQRVVKKWFGFRKGVQGNNTFLLPDIKEYNFQKVILYFEDMFQFFSLAIPVNVHKNMYYLPTNIQKKQELIQPKNTKEQTVRIEQLRKVEGEYLQYKKFEDNDDVRRIVWKVYAKNKELVVRNPERMDPFASNVNFYASFSNTLFSNYLYNDFQRVIINKYKNIVWTIFDELSKKEFVLNYISDQNIQVPTNYEIKKERFVIAMSTWQYQQKINEYFKPRIGSVLCFSSCCNIADVKEVLDNCDTYTHIFFVKGSTSFKQNPILNWISFIFFTSQNDALKKIKNKWLFSPAKKTVHRNEQNIEKLLKQYNLAYEII